MNPVSETQSQHDSAKDAFFMNIEDAYLTALKQNPVVENGRTRPQYCYYDGPLTDIVLQNFIQVPADNFSEFFSHNHLPIPELIAISHEGVVHFNEIPADIIDEIHQQRTQYKVVDYIHADSFFADPLLALNVAKQRNRIYCGHPTIDGLQICYYRGELPEHGIENLLHLELDQAIEFFVDTAYRLPTKIELPDELEDELKTSIRSGFETIVNEVKQQRRTLISQLLAQAKQVTPKFHDGEPLKIMLPSSRLTTVMQYCSRAVAKAFEKRGYQVWFYMEDGEMETNNLIKFYRNYIEFNPHVIFYVNQLNNLALNDNVTHISWWQDSMPQITEHKALRWRGNDYVFSISPVLDRHLALTGAKNIVRQHFAVDDEIFNTDGDIERQNKVVFVGSSYLNSVDLSRPEQREIVEVFIEKIDNGEIVTESMAGEIAVRFRLPPAFVFWNLLHYAIRDYSVKWLCESTAMPVDIYGRYWEQDPDVAAHFNGELKHGTQVADVYRSARYALVSHPFEINSQRLAEAAACGCIPLVYDCRDVAEKPHWDDACLFFKTRRELLEILKTQARPALSPTVIAERFTYTAAVDNFIKHSNIGELSQAKQSRISMFVGR